MPFCCRKQEKQKRLLKEGLFIVELEVWTSAWVLFWFTNNFLMALKFYSLVCLVNLEVCQSLECKAFVHEDYFVRWFFVQHSIVYTAAKPHITNSTYLYGIV